MEQNYKLTIAYDGTRFFGWERQPGKDTIQGKLESVLSRLQGHPVDVTGAGRTDAGVHARAMTANVVLDVEETPETIRDYLNRYLPDTIAVREVKEASPRFHARYNALGKTYRYICFDGPVKPVFDRKYVTLLDYRPDVERMQQAAAYLTGEHDFASFCGNPRMKKSTVRLVDSITVERRKDPRDLHVPRHRLPPEHGAYFSWYPAGGGTRLLGARLCAGHPGGKGSEAGGAHSAAGGPVPDEGGLLTRQIWGCLAKSHFSGLSFPRKDGYNDNEYTARRGLPATDRTFAC